ncbi:MAG TPA: glycosyltransferase family 39 protein, partial [Steroidobacteraceae bacterium]|nr:glycosyltransferase family 39 protein [Steroidobacteraceae bacterium]
TFFEARPLAVDGALAGFATLVAALLRLIRLGDIPYGVHPDEAGIALDAVRITEHGWIGVYSHAALGIPTLNSYLMAPGIAAFGRTAFAMRLDLAIVGLAAVPLLYALVRVSYGRAEASFAALLLAVSYWHLFYSRIAHMSISYPTLLLGALLCITVGEERGGRAQLALFAAAGALLGLSVYAYNVGAIAPLAVGAYLAVLTVTHYRSRAAWRRWRPSLAVCLAAAVIVTLPFLWYISDPHAYFWEHIRTYRDVGVTRTPEYRAADLAGKARIIADQLRTFAATYLWRGQLDYVDASGQRPIFDPASIALIASGLVLAFRRRGERMVMMAACCIVVVPLPALLQQGSMMREPLGAAPSGMFVAALPLAALWRQATGVRLRLGAAALACAALLPVAGIGAITIHDYFWTWRYSTPTRFVYHQEITSASLFMRTLPADAYVLLYSDRHPLSLETRRFLSPDTLGEDRSREFSGADAAIYAPKWNGPVVYILLGDYLPLLGAIERRYPGGTEHTARHDGLVDFYAYEIDGRTVTAR